MSDGVSLWLVSLLSVAISALIQLVGHQKRHPSCNNSLIFGGMV